MSTYKDMEQYAMENHVPVIQDEGFEFLKQLILENNFHSLLEIGTAIGYTAIRAAGLFDDMKVITIERNPDMIEQAKKNITEAGLWDKITLIEGDALNTEVEGEFDCIFIDAAKAQYQRFFNRYCPLLKPDGIIVSDNMNFHGLVEHPENTHNRNTKQLVHKIQMYRDFLQELPDWECEFYNYGDGIAVARRKK